MEIVDRNVFFFFIVLRIVQMIQFKKHLRSFLLLVDNSSIIVSSDILN